ncbi:EamA family transporter [Acinetobacter soli]|uniref:DMT family transporter n=1 Tax=Acinetobacter soli TaxID=487316 RepID=UPI001C47B14F|nr:EamA family transporter [Acinetobacter soli]MBV6551963.1 EamA family transporter [Acinetobacter soli]
MPSKSNIILTYIVLVLIWASTPLAIVWSVADLHVLWAMMLRFFLALPIAVVILLVLRIRFPLNPNAIHSYIAGSFSLIGAQVFTYIATQYLSSGVIALMFGLAPIIAGLIGRFAFAQQLNRLQWTGMATAIVGLALICFGGASQHVHPLGIGLMLMSVFIYCSSIFWVKKVNADVVPMAQATGSILVSTLVSLCVLPFVWSHAPTHLPEMKSLLALLYTTIMASLIAMFCYFKLVKNIEPTTLSLTNVMTPLLALVIGALFNHEQISLMMILGTCIILSGLFLYFYRDIQANRRYKQHIKS